MNNPYPAAQLGQDSDEEVVVCPSKVPSMVVVGLVSGVVGIIAGIVICGWRLDEECYK